MYYTPETLLNHVFEDLRKPKAPNNTNHSNQFPKGKQRQENIILVNPRLFMVCGTSNY
jgi:hypothetical protein